MLLDCCHSGSFVEKAQAREKLGALEQADYFLVTACRSFEQAYAMKAAEHSIFSTAVLSALQATDQDRVTGFDVFQQVKAALRDSGQEPIYLGSGTDVAILERRMIVSPSQISEEENDRNPPYQGLRALTPKTAGVFFGREVQTQELMGKLRGSKFVPVLGPSGSGKSSVVRAGLVTQLLKAGWQVVTMKPDDQPMANLKSALKPLFEEMSVGEQRRLMAVLTGEGLLAMARQLPEHRPENRPKNGQVLLLVDQFEEVFARCAKAAGQQFVSELLAVGQADTPLAVVMTMRSDFVDDWLRAGLPSAVIRRDTVWLGPLQGEDLKAAVEKPAQSRGYALEAGLLPMLLRDVAKEENCLPLLEFALTELWEQRDRQAKKMTL